MFSKIVHVVNLCSFKMIRLGRPRDRQGIGEWPAIKEKVIK